MTENTRFKDALIEFDKSKRNLDDAKKIFKIEAAAFMEKRGIPIKVLFFGDTFGLDIDFSIYNRYDIPRKIPLDVLTDFCKEFGCEFEYTNCDGKRYIFTFGKLSMRYMG